MLLFFTKKAKGEHRVNKKSYIYMLQSILLELPHLALIHLNFSTFSLILLSISMYIPFSICVCMKLLEIKSVHGFSTEIND